MAPATVEAQSLSALTEIASRPPRYPRNPTERPRDPLVLYLARVPGSQDIILSPLKPDQKNLTATDVHSSLYYIHKNTSSDVAYLSPEQQAKASAELNIARKPVPKSAAANDEAAISELNSLNQSRIAFLDGNGSSNVVTPRVTPPPSYLDVRKSSESAHQIARRPVSSSGGPEKMTDASTPIIRRPLGPRPIAGGAFFSKPDGMLTRETTRDVSGQSMPDANSRKTSSELPFSPTVPEEKHSLTLIRRDLASGAQWNVGYIEVTKRSSKQAKTHQVTQTAEPDWTISIKLTTPGYNQFTSTPLQGFQRDITAEYSSFWDHAFRRHQRGTSTTSLSHSRNTSSGSNFSIENTTLTTATNTATAPQSSPSKSKNRMKTYTMLSPWNGKCSFTTGGGGRSMRCLHTLASNSNTAAQQQEYERESVTVSELRYNLPGGDVFKMPPEAREVVRKSAAATARTLKRTSAVVRGWQSRMGASPSPDSAKPELPPRPSEVEGRPPLPKRPESSSYAAVYGSDDNDEDLADDGDGDGEMGLSLGREKAGGGNRGKRAKLGKLFVFDEGFKMMDLVVAANMGIWWAGWEV